MSVRHGGKHRKQEEVLFFPQNPNNSLRWTVSAAAAE